MKRLAPCLAALVLISVVWQAPAWARTPKGGADLHFDGHCDGIHFFHPSAGLGTDETIDGYQTGCGTGDIFGQKTSRGLYVTISGFSTFTVIRRDKTWTHYALNGDLLTILNSGTWSLGPPSDTSAPSSATPPTVARYGPLATTSSNTIDITFDGRCDGMHLNIPSAGLRTFGTIDGYLTGCSNSPLMGATASVDKKPMRAVTFFQGSMWISAAIFLDQTWIYYAVASEKIYVLDSGTWSYA